MNIILIDDDVNFLNSFKNKVLSYSKSIFDSVCIETTNNISTSFKKIYDIYFLDIDLIDKNGISVAKEIKNHNKNAKIIFVTSKNDLVYNAITVQPFYFIRKNNLDSDLSVAFLLLKDYFIEKEFYALKYESEDIKIYLENIIFIETNDHLSTIQTTSRQFHLYKSLKDLIKEINSSLLIQVNRNTCVNLMYVVKQKKDKIILENNKEIKLGIPYKITFEKKLSAFINEGDAYDNV